MKAASRCKIKSKPGPSFRRLIAIYREIDKGREPIEETPELIREIQREIQKYRAEKRRRK